MITTEEIHDALDTRIQTLSPAREIVFPNVFGDEDADIPAYPFIIADIDPGVVRDDTVKGGLERHEGFAFFYVMTARGANKYGGIEVAQSVKDLFPRGLRIATDSGEVCITQPPQIMMGFLDGPHWKTPVKINYEAS